MQSIFLLGSERSGSNLLRTLLGNHSQISAPIAPHLCDVFYKRFKYYLPLTKSREELLSDINIYLNHDFNEWDIKLDIKNPKIKELSSFVDFLHFAFTQKAEVEGKTVYFSKDNHNHEYALGILKDIPNVKFIYLYRDPRDQVASWMRTPIHLHTPYAAINKWKKEQEAIQGLKNFYQVEMYSLKYEDLVDDPSVEMGKVLEYLELNVESACFQTNRKNREAEKHPLWKNINQPIRKNNYNKYKDVLSINEINLIETTVSEMMQTLGYEFETTRNWAKGNPYVFALKEKMRVRKSLIKNKKFLENEMEVLMDKHKLIQNIFSKFNK